MSVRKNLAIGAVFGGIAAVVAAQPAIHNFQQEHLARSLLPHSTQDLASLVVQGLSKKLPKDVDKNELAQRFAATMEKDRSVTCDGKMLQPDVCFFSGDETAVSDLKKIIGEALALKI